MSLEFGWRRFNFFDKSVVLDKEKPKEKFLGLKDVNVDCWCSSGDSVFLGEAKGGVFRLTQQHGEYYWKAYQKSLASLHSAGKYLFSIGEDDETVNSLLKIWDPTIIEKNAPQMRKSVRMSPLLAASAFPASHCAVHSSLTAIAVGYGDGSVLFYQGDVINDKSINSRWLRIRETSVIDGAITGLAIAFVPGGKTVLFAITPKHVFSYVLENRQVVSKKKHEANGATADCWTFDESTGQLIVASREMVYFYDADQSVDVDGGVGRCLQLGRGHDKLQLVAAGGGQYLALLTKQHALIQKEAEFMTMMTVYDVKGQYIGFSCSLPNLCRLFVIGAQMLILSKDGTLSELTEKNLMTKLDILIKKNLYDVAVGIAKNSKDGGDQLKTIHRKYADYLYGKGDYDNAINEYKETIGVLEPSYVIKKYLDGSKLQQLCVYLESIHDQHQDNSNHTNILLNAYARRGEKSKLKQFVNKLAERKNADMRQVFSVFIEWGYYDEAALLAAKFAMPIEALTVLIDHQQKYTMALKHIANSRTANAVDYLERFGRTLLEKSRDETMSLLLDVVQRATQDEELDFTRLFEMFVGDSAAAERFIEFAMEKATGPVREQLRDVVVEIRMRAYDPEKTSRAEINDKLISLLTPSNTAHCLHLAQIFNVSPVVEHILSKCGKHGELMKYYQKIGDLPAIIELCKTCPVEEERQKMWLDALSYISKCENEAANEEIIKSLLVEIEKSQSVHPLVVLEILSKSHNLTISTVKEYVINWLQKQETKIEMDRKTIKDNEKTMEELDENIESLKFNAQVLQVAKCSACDTGLQLPTVHFLCKHSYHVHCFDSYSEVDSADTCPACSHRVAKGGTVVEEDDEPRGGGGTVEFGDRAAYARFQKELATSGNAMELIATYLERGLFNDEKKSKGHAGRRSIAAHLTSQRSSTTTTTNPFDDDDFRSVSRTMSTVSTNNTVPQKTVALNPFEQEPEAKNPFGDDF